MVIFPHTINVFVETLTTGFMATATQSLLLTSEADAQPFHTYKLTEGVLNYDYVVYTPVFDTVIPEDALVDIVFSPTYTVKAIVKKFWMGQLGGELYLLKRSN